MKFRYATIPLLYVLLLSAMASCGPYQKHAVEKKITDIANHFARDSRVALFDVTVESGNGDWILHGETNIPEAKRALVDSLSNINVQVTDSIKILPASELDGKTFALVNNSVANLRSTPSHTAQLVSQATLGMPLKVLKKQAGWYLVQTPDDYLSWVDEGGIQLVEKTDFEEWRSASKIIYLDIYGFAYEHPDRDSLEISDLVAGSILKVTDTAGEYYHVSYPDGRTGYVFREETQNFDSWKESAEATEERLVETAKSMKGVPYLWGGTSAKGVDCSGFTKTVYFMNGWIIPRDASQQVHAGEAIDTSDGFDNLRPGDLLFFGKPATDSTTQRVVHVGMWIGDDQFIHSTGRVRISSVDSTSGNFDRYNLNRYLETRRYLNNWTGNIIKAASMYEQIN